MSTEPEHDFLLIQPGSCAENNQNLEISQMIKRKFPQSPGKNTRQSAYPRYSFKPLAYTSNFKDNTVSVIEVKTGVKVIDIPVGSCPYGLDISPDQRFVYAANMNDATLSVISTRKNRVVNTIDLNHTSYLISDPIGVKVSPKGDLIYVAGFRSSNMLVVDAYLQQVIAEVPFENGMSPYDLAVTADGKLAFVTLLSANKVAVVDLTVNLPVKIVDVGEWPTAVKIAKQDPLALVVAEQSKSLSVINTTIAEVSPNRIDFNSSPGDVVVSSRENIAYVSNDDDAIKIVNVFTHNIIGDIKTENRPYRLALSADDRYLVATNNYSNTLSIIDTRKRALIGTATAGFNTAFVAIAN